MGYLDFLGINSDDLPICFKKNLAIYLFDVGHK